MRGGCRGAARRPRRGGRDGQELRKAQFVLPWCLRVDSVPGKRLSHDRICSSIGYHTPLGAPPQGGGGGVIGGGGLAHAPDIPLVTFVATTVDRGLIYGFTARLVPTEDSPLTMPRAPFLATLHCM